jgi:hypothetical protein
MHTMLLVVWMAVSTGTPEERNAQQRATDCLEVVENKSQGSLSQSLKAVATRCGQVITRPACAEQFRAFYGSTGRRSTLRSLYAACRGAYCEELGPEKCPKEASDDPRVLHVQWQDLSLALLEREVGESTAWRLHKGLRNGQWRGESGQRPAPTVVSLSGKEPVFRLELLLDGKSAGSWKLSDPPTPSEYVALLKLVDKKRPGEFSIHVKVTKSVIFGHLKLLMMALTAQGFHALHVDIRTENDAPPTPAR